MASTEQLARKTPSLFDWIVVGACAIGIAVVRNLERMDSGMANVVTLILTFVASMTLLLWFVRRSDYPLRLRWGVLLCLFGLVTLAIATLRVEEVRGNMVPRFAFRWTPKHDATLAHPTKRTKDDSQDPSADPATDYPLVDLVATTPHDYPQFLGPGRNATLAGPRLARDWQAHPPKLVWKRPIGAGWSAFAVVNGFAVTMEQRGSEEGISCYRVSDGEPMWWQSINTRHETVLGGAGPRGTPTIHEGRVYALGATGWLRCLDGATGDVVWKKNLLEMFGLTLEQSEKLVAWGRAGSPLVVDDLVVVPAGGTPGKRTRSLAAFDPETGDLVWEGGDTQVAYASPSVATLAGVRQILSVNESDVTGHNIATGKMLWRFPWDGNSAGAANNSQAVPFGEDRVFISKGYATGCAAFQVKRTGERWSATLLDVPGYPNNRSLSTKFTNVVVRDGSAFGLSEGILECLELATGRRRWKQGRYGHGQVLLVDDLMLVQGESGEMALVEATPDAYRELGRFQALDGKTWNNPTLFGRLLLVRNALEAACYELAVK